MGDKVLAWLKSKNITSHTVAGAIFIFAVAYNTDPQVRDFIGKMFVGYPVVVTKLGILCVDIAAVGVMWAKYSKSRTTEAITKDAEAAAPINPDPNRPLTPPTP